MLSTLCPTPPCTVHTGSRSAYLRHRRHGISRLLRTYFYIEYIPWMMIKPFLRLVLVPPHNTREQDHIGFSKYGVVGPARMVVKPRTIW